VTAHMACQHNLIIGKIEEYLVTDLGDSIKKHSAAWRHWDASYIANYARKGILLGRTFQLHALMSLTGVASFLGFVWFQVKFSPFLVTFPVASRIIRDKATSDILEITFAIAATIVSIIILARFLSEIIGVSIERRSIQRRIIEFIDKV